MACGTVVKDEITRDDASLCSRGLHDDRSPSNVTLMEYRGGRISQEEDRRWGTPRRRLAQSSGHASNRGSRPPSLQPGRPEISSDGVPAGTGTATRSMLHETPDLSTRLPSSLLSSPAQRGGESTGRPPRTDHQRKVKISRVDVNASDGKCSTAVEPPTEIGSLNTINELFQSKVPLHWSLPSTLLDHFDYVSREVRKDVGDIAVGGDLAGK